MYSVDTRTCAVTIFASLLNAIYVNTLNDAENVNIFDPVLSVFIEQLLIAIGTSINQYSSFTLKAEIIKGMFL